MISTAARLVRAHLQSTFAQHWVNDMCFTLIFNDQCDISVSA